MLKKLIESITKMQGFNLSQEQADNIALIYYACIKHGIVRKRHIAYIFATVFHEAARREMIGSRVIYRRVVCVEEMDKGGTRRYARKVKYSGKPYTTPDKIFYGRGFVQITWYEVYEKFGKVLKIDLLNNPELALVPKISADIVVVGMRDGLFTGVKLEKYFNDTTTDSKNARRIINVLDKWDIIANYYDVIFNNIKGEVIA